MTVQVASPSNEAAIQKVCYGTTGGDAAVQAIAGVALQTEQGVLQTRKTVEDLVRLAQELTETLSRFKLAA